MARSQTTMKRIEAKARSDVQPSKGTAQEETLTVSWR
jgi:hypothetical protein